MLPMSTQGPIFGKPPRMFSYKELEEATDGFSSVNFLAEGGFGVVSRGVLRDGQMVAVKLLKFDGSQADADFGREVRVLSCAQHRNVVMLIGFCIDSRRRVLVYEFICNGSLDFHLHGNITGPLDWQSRLKLAIGAAQEDRVIGSSGYLAPEYVNGGKIAQKVDVYAFGVVLLELMTGQRTSKLQHYKGHYVLSDWFHPLASLEPGLILEKIYFLIDPYLASNHDQNFTHQLQAMARAAFLCLCTDPESKPSMSKVLRILEGGETAVPLALDFNSVGNRSGHLPGLSSRRQQEGRRTHSRRLSH